VCFGAVLRRSKNQNAISIPHFRIHVRGHLRAAERLRRYGSCRRPATHRPRTPRQRHRTWHASSISAYRNSDSVRFRDRL
jgi:hypothetical protein